MAESHANRFSEKLTLTEFTIELSFWIISRLSNIHSPAIYIMPLRQQGREHFTKNPLFSENSQNGNLDPQMSGSGNKQAQSDYQKLIIFTRSFHHRKWIDRWRCHPSDVVKSSRDRLRQTTMPGGVTSGRP